MIHIRRVIVFAYIIPSSPSLEASETIQQQFLTSRGKVLPNFDNSNHHDDDITKEL